MAESLCMGFFFFQAEDGIRDLTVTGVQTCALPISAVSAAALTVLLTACASSARRAPQPAERIPLPAPVPPPPAGVESIPDAVPRLEPRSAHGNPPFYDVLGRRYFVLTAADGYLERGVASWYGPTFHGGNTSSGEPYDMYGD